MKTNESAVIDPSINLCEMPSSFHEVSHK